MDTLHVIMLLVGIALVVSGLLDLTNRLLPWALLHMGAGVLLALLAFGTLS